MYMRISAVVVANDPHITTGALSIQGTFPKILPLRGNSVFFARCPRNLQGYPLFFLRACTSVFGMVCSRGCGMMTIDGSAPTGNSKHLR